MLVSSVRALIDVIPPRFSAPHVHRHFRNDTRDRPAIAAAMRRIRTHYLTIIARSHSPHAQCVHRKRALCAYTPEPLRASLRLAIGIIPKVLWAFAFRAKALLDYAKSV
ncbi:hypothetical protein THI4931_12270 [Pandoraea sputorum]|nr:hypothetical protein THI4931_12270 [Pandoraea sputorum]